MHSIQRGFTLLELLVTLIIFGMLLAFGLPSMVNTIRNSAIKQVTNELISDIRFARSQAVSLGTPVTLCRLRGELTCHPGSSGNGFDWQADGWMVFSDEDLDKSLNSTDDLLRERPPTSKANVQQNATPNRRFGAALVFHPDGTMRDSLKRISQATFVICPNGSGNIARQLTITGRGGVKRTNISAADGCN